MTKSNKLRIDRSNENKACVKCCLLGVCGLFLCLTFSVRGSQTQLVIQPLEEIRQAAINFLEEKQDPADRDNIEIIISDMDPRIKLRRCNEELNVFLPQQGLFNQNRFSLAIRCRAAPYWKIYLQVKIKRYMNVWVTRRSLLKGDQLKKSDLIKQRLGNLNLRKSPILDLRKNKATQNMNEVLLELDCVDTN